GGTTRAESGSELSLRAALEVAEREGARVRLFGGAELAKLPIYDKDAAGNGHERKALVEAVREADGLIIASPGYHGSISGMVKNALDGLEDLRQDGRPYLHGRAVGLIVIADGWQAGGSTLASLRAIVHALRGWPTPFGAVLNATSRSEDDEMRLSLVAEQVLEFARLKIGG
ncbi:MAG TPA: NAD(P)H-dependent oxidoreductase, partial [Caulobacteraceae bacterium]|nr:NAD(P)H-dependent oxidoreductase [Caulobacteraceae bacterium]